MCPFLFEPNVVLTLCLTRSARPGSGPPAPENAVQVDLFLSPEQTYTTTWANTHPLTTPPSLAPKPTLESLELRTRTRTRTHASSHTPLPDTFSLLPPTCPCVQLQRQHLVTVPDQSLCPLKAVRHYTGCSHHYTTPLSAGSRPAGLFLIHSRGCRRPPPPLANPLATISAGCHSSCTRPGH